MELTGGCARFMEAHVAFREVLIEPLQTEADGTWWVGVDGDNVPLRGACTITNLPRAVRMVAPAKPMPSPDFIKPRNLPASQKALEANRALGGTETEVDSGCVLM